MIKAHATSTGAFTSPNGGPLGYLVEGRVVLLNRPTGRTVIPPVDGEPTVPRVPLFMVVLDEDTAGLDAPAGQADGLVVAGFGVGHVPESHVPVLEAAAARIPVVLCSRTGAGSTLTGTYGFPGSESDLIARGLIPAGHLHPLKARVLLRALLAARRSPDAIRAAVAAAGQTDGTV